jgi:exodeoxyribonuclease VII large subunit
MDFLTLSQLNSLVSEEIKLAFPDTYWILAETSDVRLNKNGHCYLEFIEKEENTGNIIAKARAYIWKNTFLMLNPFFEEKTGQSFVSGIKVLVNVSVDFHPLYGYGLSVCDIDPTYTLGDIQRKRQEILHRLEEEGILTLNQELELPLVLQRIAVITSPTAAGYEDFLDHLLHNKQGFAFYPHLFPAVMQGDRTESSIIAALDTVYAHKDQFDAVAIIRGGGATSDLLAFDSYLLAANCAQFPLPVITGIGHERDNTVLDFVSFYRAKTPTAVADYLVDLAEETFEELASVQEAITSGAKQWMESSSLLLQKLTVSFPLYLNTRFEKENYALCTIENNLRQSGNQFLINEAVKLKEKESFFQLSSPEYILAKGYSITLKNGKAVKDAEILNDRDEIRTVLAQGEIISVVQKNP